MPIGWASARAPYLAKKVQHLVKNFEAISGVRSSSLGMAFHALHFSFHEHSLLRIVGTVFVRGHIVIPPVAAVALGRAVLRPREHFGVSQFLDLSKFPARGGLQRQQLERDQSIETASGEDGTIRYGDGKCRFVPLYCSWSGCAGRPRPPPAPPVPLHVTSRMFLFPTDASSVAQNRPNPSN